MKVIREMNLENFEFWSGAKITASTFTKEELLQLQDILEDIYPEGLSETLLNDIFWFETDWLCELLNIPIEEFEDRYLPF